MSINHPFLGNLIAFFKDKPQDYSEQDLYTVVATILYQCGKNYSQEQWENVIEGVANVLDTMLINRKEIDDRIARFVQVPGIIN